VFGGRLVLLSLYQRPGGLLCMHLPLLSVAELLMMMFGVDKDDQK